MLRPISRLKVVTNRIQTRRHYAEFGVENGQARQNFVTFRVNFVISGKFE